MTRQWKLCSNEQEQNFQVIDEQGLPVCVMCTAKGAVQANWHNKKLPAKVLWQSVADAQEQAHAMMIVAAPALWLLAQRVAVALPGDLPGLIREAQALVSPANRGTKP